jgi:GLPGLI family protein
MKFKYIKTILLSLITLSGFAQQGEPVVLSVTYNFKHVNDLNKPNMPYQEEMILRLGKTESRYNSWTDEIKSKAPSKIISSGNSSSPKSSGNFSFTPTVFVKGKGVQDFDLLQYHTKNKLVRITTLGSSNYIIETDIPSIAWKIEPEKKEIGGYICQKAVGSYGGRVYTAWFAQKLPFKSGPWKLSGLPGLILEARDSTAEVSFLFKEINKGAENETTAPRKARVIKASESAFERAKNAFEKDPIAVYQSQLPVGTTEKAQIVFADDEGNFHYGEEGKKLYEANKKAAKQRKFNPIELKKS